jgi:hypothetical protein
MKNKDFAIFILTHGRPNNVKTLNTLNNCGYTGKIYFIVDNEDKSIKEYQNNYGIENVRIFDKKEMADSIDEGNNFDERRTITHARNACFKIAKEIGVTYFIQLDDDYTSFEWRYESNDGKKLKVHKITNLNNIIDLYLEFYKNNNFKTIAFAQGGDFIGGVKNPYVKKRPLLRKCMNSFFCSTEREFKFIGAMNEDVNTYTTLGSRGELFGTIPMISLTQTATQSQKNGITDMYNKFGTYCKSFTTVMMHPSGTKVSIMNTSNPRIHHSIKWNNTTPMIISEKYKK